MREVNIMKKTELINYLDQFMDYSSYLLWGENVGDITPITTQDTLIEQFNSKYVFAALNQCSKVKKYTNFHNIHSAGDSKLMKTIELRPSYKGSFITDVFAGDEYETKNGSELKKKLKENKYLESKGLDAFINRIKPLLDTGAHVIALGTECFKFLSKCPQLNNRLHVVPHFSSSKSYEERCAALDLIKEDCEK